MYRERPSRLPGAVVWVNEDVGSIRVLPDGCMDLLWDGDAIVVAGPDTHAQVHPGPTRYTGLRFAPGAGPAVVGVPAGELVDARVPLDALWHPADARRMADIVAAGADAGAGLERVAARRCGPRAPDAALVDAVLTRLGAGMTVSQVAREVGLGVRQLHRRCRDSFGYGPKTLARILRMTGALDLARAGVGLADVAARSGYADQAHLSREIKELAGLPLRQLLAASGAA